MALLPSPTDRSAWADTARKESCCCTTRKESCCCTTRKESCCCTKWRRHGLWKRRGVEKSKTRLSHPAWKSRKRRGIPTFPQPRRRLVNLKTGHITCYKNRTF